MTATIDQVLERIDSAVQDISRRPEYYGSLECVEVQALTLLSLRSFTMNPAAHNAYPTRVTEAWRAHLEARGYAVGERLLADVLRARNASYDKSLTGLHRRTMADEIDRFRISLNAALVRASIRGDSALPESVSAVGRWHGSEPAPGQQPTTPDIPSPDKDVPRYGR